MTKPDTLTEAECKDLVLLTRGYLGFPGHKRRVHSLDRMCAEQRLMQVWFKNKNSRVRKRSVVESFHYWLNWGCDRAEALRRAYRTQLNSCQGVERLNVDSRTTWLLTPEETK